MRVNQDLDGRGEGGAAPTSEVRELWKVVNSENRFWRV